MPLAVAALAVATVGTGYSIYNGERAAKENKKAQALQRQANQITEARNKRDSIRQARMAYAKAQQTAENQNVSISSSSQGGLGSIQSQVGSNLSFLDQISTINDQASAALGKAATFEQRSRTAGAVADLGFTAFSNSGAVESTFAKMFKKTGT